MSQMSFIRVPEVWKHSGKLIPLKSLSKRSKTQIKAAKTYSRDLDRKTEELSSERKQHSRLTI